MNQSFDADDALRSQGYVILRDVIPSGLLRDLGNAVSRLQEEDRARFGAEWLHRIGQEGFVVNVADRGPEFEQLLVLRPAFDVIDRILGPSSCLYLFQGVVVPPGGGFGAYPWKWHCDLYHVITDVRVPDFIVGLNLLLFLDDVDERNGGTWIIPGSQGLPSEEMPCAAPEFLQQSALQVRAPAGSAVLFNPLLWHCAGANGTDRPRRAVKMLMVRDWVLPQMDYVRSVRPEVLARLDSEALRVLGHRRPVARTFGEFARNAQASARAEEA